jgi:hypothetical protein
MIGSIVHCDAVHPERTPPECRAYLPVPPSETPPAYAKEHGWVAASKGRWLCPSCAGAAARAVRQAVGWV